MASDLPNVTAALVALTEAGIPTDVQELLVRGDASRGIAPGAIIKALNTRPAPAATDTGLETVEADDIPGCPACGHAGRTGNVICDICTPVKDATGKCGKLETVGAVRQETIDGVALGQIGFIHPVGYDQQPIELVTRSQAEELLAEKDKEIAALQQLLEERRNIIASLIPRAPNCGRYLAECNDGRLLYLNHGNTWQECPNFIETKDKLIQSLIDFDSEEVKRLEVDNASLTARIKELEHVLAEARGNAKNASSNCIYWRGQTEALEAKLAAAEKSLRKIAESKDAPFRIKVHALAALGGKS